MQKPSSPGLAWRRNIPLFIIALLVIAVDQLTKLAVELNLAVGQSVPEAGFFRFTHVHNTGASFGMFQGQYLALAVISIVGICVLLYLALGMSRRFPLLDTTLARVALGLMLGGMIGNLIDRLSQGYVTDFINFSFWPAFNVADSSTVIGALLLAYALLRLAWKDELPDGKDT